VWKAFIVLGLLNCGGGGDAEITATIATTPGGKSYPVTGDFVPGSIVEPNSGFTIPWQLFVPRNASPSVPLAMVIWVGGAGQRGNDNVQNINTYLGAVVDSNKSTFPVFVFFPQLGSAHGDPADQIAWTDALGPEIAQLRQTYSIDTTRITLVGYSAGSVILLPAAYEWPKLFAGISTLDASIHSVYWNSPATTTLQQKIDQYVSVTGDLPWLAHQSTDPTAVNVTESFAEMKLLKLSELDTHTNSYSASDRRVHNFWDNDDHSSLPDHVVALSDAPFWNWIYAQHR
jgi:predicted peptidase